MIFVATDEVFSFVATDEICAGSNFVEALNYTHFASFCPCPLYEDAALAQMLTVDYLQTSYNTWGTLGHIRGARFCNEYLTDEEEKKEKLGVDFYLTSCESQH